MESPARQSSTSVEVIPVEQFVKLVSDSGLMAANEIEAFVAGLPTAQQGETRHLAGELVKQQKLTRYQAQMLCQGKAKGLTLGNYLILDKLGQGGMGVVFKARHRHLGRVVALKVLPASVCKNPTSVKRFQREVQAAAKLSHPNIVAAYDADEDKGVYFYVMEYIDGSDLSRAVKQKGPMPAAQAVDCLLQAAQGLAYAHSRGVIHRDIKPHNLLMSGGVVSGGVVNPETTHHSPLTTHQVVKVLDMGLARVDGGANASDGSTSELTESGSIMGTCDYMAPEQALNTKKADQRADIYSLGCTLYFLLTGKAMYKGDTSMEKLMAHREEPIPPLPAVAEALQDVFRRMVAKKAGERYQSMDEVIADLEKVQARGDLASTVREPPSGGRQPPEPAPSAGWSSMARPQHSATEAAARRRDGVTRGQMVGAAVVMLVLVGVIAVAVYTSRGTKGPEKKGMTEPPVDAKVVVQPPQPVALQPALAQEIDLLTLIDPKKHAVKGQWRFEGQTLVTGHEGDARLQVPYAPPLEYEIDLEARRAAGSDTLSIGLVGGDTQFLVNLDGRGGTFSGLEMLDGRNADNNETSHQGTVLPRGQVVKVTCTVLRDGVTVACNGKVIINWKGDYRRLSMQPAWQVPERAQLFLRAGSSTFHISKMVLCPLPPAREIDLLKLIDPQKHADGRLKGRWHAEGQALVSGGEWARVQVPQTPPAEYELEMDIRRAAPTGDVTVGLAAGNHQFSVSFDAFTELTGLSCVDGKPLRDNGTAVKQRIIRSDRPTAISIKVMAGKVVVKADGKEIVNWTGDLSRLSRGTGANVSKDPLTIGTHAGAFHISKLVLRPLGNTPQPRTGDDAWIKMVQSLPAGKQVDAVADKLKELNPGFDGKVEHKIKNGLVTELAFVTDAVRDISPVRGLTALDTLRCVGSAGRNGKVVDLSPLRGMPLRHLNCGYNQLADLAPLQGMPLATFACNNTGVVDLSPLKGMPLTSFACFHTSIADLSPLKEARLTSLLCYATKITDLSIVKGMPLMEYNGPFKRERDTEILRSIKTLKMINLRSAAEFWKEMDERQAAFDSWAKSVQALPPEKQVDAVADKLKELNPGFDGKVEHKIDKGVVTQFTLYGRTVKDLTPVRVFAGLKDLNCCETGVSDLAPIQGMPLTHLRCWSTAISDLSPLKGTSLRYLDCFNTRVSDLSPLQGMPLTFLKCDRCDISDLSPLAGMPLVYLWCTGAKITDLSPLKDVPLKELGCDFNAERDAVILRSIKTLKKINGKPAVEFWKGVDTKKP